MAYWMLAATGTPVLDRDRPVSADVSVLDVELLGIVNYSWVRHCFHLTQPVKVLIGLISLISFFAVKRLLSVVISSHHLLPAR